MIDLFSGDNIRYVIELRDGFLPRLFFNKALIVINELIKFLSHFSPHELILAYVDFLRSFIGFFV